MASITLLLSIVFMTLYLWRAGWLKNDGRLYSLTTPLLLLLALVGGVSVVFIEDFLLSHLRFLPNWMEQTFDTMQAGWPGIVGIAVLGPVLEELLFRGAITKVLLQKYSPAKAIFLSALVFGVFHLNPVQIVAAFFAGLFFAWLYWRTGSVIPCILVHIFNNGFSVYTSVKYPDMQPEYFSDIMPTVPYFLCLAVALALLTVCVKLINDKTKAQ